MTIEERRIELLKMPASRLDEILRGYLGIPSGKGLPIGTLLVEGILKHEYPQAD